MFDVHSKERKHWNQNHAAAHSAHGTDKPGNDRDYEKEVK
jgi:hypothetical protein